MAREPEPSAAPRPGPAPEAQEKKEEEEYQAVSSPQRTMPRSTHEVPLYWRDADRGTSVAWTALVKLAQAADHGTGLLMLRAVTSEGRHDCLH